MGRKSEGKKKTTPAAAAAVAAEEAASGDADREQAALELLTLFERWEQTRELAATERKRCKENVDAKVASFKQAVETGTSKDSERLLKLNEVETQWQELEDARTERKEVNGAMKDNVMLAETKIREKITAIKSNQIGLPFAGGLGASSSPDSDDDEHDLAREKDQDDDEDEK